MTVNKRKKLSRMRGTHTHGWGAKKKHRGAGHRGGRGMAGSGKRADQKKPTILKLYGNKYYGKSGFKRPQKVIQKIKPVNIGYIALKLKQYTENKLVTKEGEFYIIDAEKLGYNKILGGGNVNVKLKIKALQVTQRAAQKIEASGGSIIKEDVFDK